MNSPNGVGILNKRTNRLHVYYNKLLTYSECYVTGIEFE